MFNKYEYTSKYVFFYFLKINLQSKGNTFDDILDFQVKRYDKYEIVNTSITEHYFLFK